jgi:hypothetical protein
MRRRLNRGFRNAKCSPVLAPAIGRRVETVRAGDRRPTCSTKGSPSHSARWHGRSGSLGVRRRRPARVSGRRGREAWRNRQASRVRGAARQSAGGRQRAAPRTGPPKHATPSPRGTVSPPRRPSLGRATAACSGARPIREDQAAPAVPRGPFFRAALAAGSHEPRRLPLARGLNTLDPCLARKGATEVPGGSKATS